MRLASVVRWRASLLRLDFKLAKRPCEILCDPGENVVQSVTLGTPDSVGGKVCDNEPLVMPA